MLGPEWLPLAQVLRYYLQERIASQPLFMLIYGEQYVRDEMNKEGPIVRLTKTYQGEYILEISSNIEINPPLDRYLYQQMEFLRFTVPKTTKGNFAVDPTKRIFSNPPHFRRVSKGSTSMVKIIALIITTLVCVFGSNTKTQFYFGRNIVVTRDIHNLNLFDRYKATDGNPKAEILGFKGEPNDIPLFGSKAKSKTSSQASDLFVGNGSEKRAIA
jgi:hypothetical protein